MTTPVSGATGATGPAQVVRAPAEGADKDMFMKMLVAQLKYQNPMAPTDGNQYMNQMAAFSQVEKLGQLVEAQTAVQQWQQRIAAEALVGKRVSGLAEDGQTVTGTVASVSFADAVMTLDDGSKVAVENVLTVERT